MRKTNKKNLLTIMQAGGRCFTLPDTVESNNALGLPI
jgi:hypothetical protein